MANDFYIKFDSNAPTFAAELKSELATAKTALSELGTEIDTLMGKGRAVAPLIKKLNEQRAATGGGGRGGPTPSMPEIDTSKITRDLDKVSVEIQATMAGLGSLVKLLTGTVETARNTPTGKASRAQLELRERGGGTPNGPGGRFTSPSDPVMASFLAKTATLTKPPTTPVISTNVGSLTKLELDKGGFDRVVKAIDKLRKAIVSGVPVRGGGAPAPSPGPVVAVDTTPAPVAPTTPAAPSSGKAKDKGKTPTVAEQEAQLAAAESGIEKAKQKLDRLTASLPQMEASIAELVVAMGKASGASADEAKALITQARTVFDETKAEIAKLERETTGVSRKDQKAGRRSKAQEKREAEQAETDRLLSLPAAGERFIESIGRGKEQLKGHDLHEINKRFEALGIQTGIKAKTKVPEMGQLLVAARGQYEAQFGSLTTAEIKASGKKGDKIPKAIREMLGDVSRVVEDSRKQVRIAYQAGHVPPAATLADTGRGGRVNLLNVETSPIMEGAIQHGVSSYAGFGVANRNLSEMYTQGVGGVHVPRGMVKGGEYSDQFNLMGKGGALTHIADTFFSKAAALSTRASFDPYAKQERITGGGPEARAARLNMADLRRGSEELDNLGRQFKVFGNELFETEQFIERATWRLDRLAEGRKLTPAQLEKTETDPTKRFEAQEKADRLRGNLETLTARMTKEMGAGDTQLLTGLFGSAEYQHGLSTRDESRAARAKALDEAAERGRQALVSFSDASGRAVTGRRQANNAARGTSIGNIAGLVFREGSKGKPGRYEYPSVSAEGKHGQSRPAQDNAELDKLNRLHRSYNSALTREANLKKKLAEDRTPEERAKLEEQLQRSILKGENKGSAFLNELNEKFGAGSAPSLQKITGRAPTTEANIASEASRQKEYRARQATVTKKATPKTEEEIYAGRKEAVGVAEKALAETNERLAEAREKALRLQEKANAAFAQASAEDRATVERKHDLERAQRKLENQLIKSDAGRLRSATGQIEQGPLPAPTSTQIRASLANLAKKGKDELTGEDREKEQARLKGLYEKATPAPFRSLVDTLSSHRQPGEQGPLLESGRFREVSTQAGHLQKEIAALEGEISQIHLPEALKEEEEAAKKAAKAEARLIKERDKLQKTLEKRVAELATTPATSTPKETDTAAPAAPTTKAKVAAAATGAKVVSEEVASDNAELTALQTQYLAGQGAVRERTRLRKAIKKAKSDEDKTEQARLQRELASLREAGVPDRATQTGLRDQIKAAGGSLTKAGILAAKKTGAKAQVVEEVASDNAELAALQSQYLEGQGAVRERTRLRKAIKKAKKDNDKTGREALQQELASLREAGVPERSTQKALRGQINTLVGANAGGAAGGNGAGTGGGGTGGGRGAGAGGGAGSGAGRGFDAQSHNILRDILTALNGIHRTLQEGIKVKGGQGATRTVKLDETGTPIPRKPGPRTGVPQSELSQAKSTDPREVAKAAAAQRRRLEALKESGRFEETLERAHGQAVQKNIRLENQATDQTRKSTEIERARVRELQQVAKATALLDQESQHELAILRQLNAAGASAVQITEQQRKAVIALNAALARQGQGATERRRSAQTLLSEANVRTNPHGQVVQGPRISKGEVDEIYRDAGPAVQSVKTTSKNMASAIDPNSPFGTAVTAMFGKSGFWSRVIGSTGTFLVRNFTAGFVFGLTNVLQEMISQAVAAESTFVRISDALEQTGRSAGGLRTELQGISTEYGTNLQDVYEIAAGLTGMFDNVKDIASATRIVSQLQLISKGALTAEEAMGALASITGGYQDQLAGGVEGLNHVADVLTVVQNVIGTNIEVTSEGVGSLSGLSEQLKIDFEDMAVYVSQIAKLTNQTGAAAGEQFSRILGAMQTGRGHAVLTKALPDTGIDTLLGKGDYGGALKVLMKNWDDLSDSQQRNIAVTLGGLRQQRSFAGLMHDTQKTLNASARAHDANGQAAQRASEISKQLTAQIQKLTSNLQNFMDGLLRSGVLDFLGLALRMTNSFLGGVNHLLSLFNDVTDNNAFLRFLKHIGVGLLGLILTMKLAGKAFLGLQASLRATAAANAGTGVVAAGLQGASAPITLSQIPAAGASKLKGVAERLKEKGQGIAATRSALQQTAENAAASGAPYMPVNQGGLRGRLGLGAVSETPGMLSKGVPANARAYLAVSNAAKGAEKALAGVGKGLEAVSGAGLLAQVGLVAAVSLIAAIVDVYKGAAEREKKARDLIKRTYGPGGYGRAITDEPEYVGPYTELANANKKATKPWTTRRLYEAGQGLQNIPGVNAVRDVKDLFTGKGLNVHNQINNEDEFTGKVSDSLDARLDHLVETSVKKLDKADPGGGKPAGLFSNVFKKAQNTIIDSMKTAGVRLKPDLTVKQARKLGSDINKAARAEAQRIINDPTQGENQRAAALATIEQLQHATNERIASMILVAQGVAKADQLNMDQVDQLSELEQLFTSTASQGEVNFKNPKYAAVLKRLIKDAAIRPESDLGKALADLGKGTLSRSETFAKLQTSVDKRIEALSARYLAFADGTKTPDEGELDEVKKKLEAALAEKAKATETALGIFLEEVNAVAAAAAGAGDYAAAASQESAGVTRFHRKRDLKSENPETAAKNRVTEQTLSQQAATHASEALNESLEVSKARSMSAQKDAGLERRIAGNNYRALIHQKQVAEATGAEGPPAEAIRAAKTAWIEAQNNFATTAQAANITSMTLAAAGLWNGIASAEAAEGIAFQQYLDAKKNAGAKSTEARAALANYIGSQKNTLTTRDSVAAATRDAATAAIPQGDAVRVTRRGVANARAALAAARKYGVNSNEYQGALSTLYSSQQSAQTAQAAVTAAQLQLGQAYADARGDAVASARASIGVARAALRAALKASGGVRSADVLAAQAQLVAANAQLNQSQADLVQSRVAVSIAIADAAGHTVHSAVLQLRAARLALRAALRRSGGENTAEVNAARAATISARAAARDASLQDKLDTIDFNLQMGKITQSSAIAAMQQILRTANLTRQQRRDLLLRIKGMKDSLADDQWNFGDIKLPTPYEMRRYIETQKNQRVEAVKNSVGMAATAATGPTVAAAAPTTNNQTVQIAINGADTAVVRRIVTEIVGGATRTRTTGHRRTR